ncbi:hypothetical protein [Dinoroseobacter sp. S124A]|uniref:hypothetical protein n=1 Tax=Dinoroseobacter sp. S124A TaxID=3415128 RepID=UPI003C7991FE
MTIAEIIQTPPKGLSLVPVEGIEVRRACRNRSEALVQDHQSLANDVGNPGRQHPLPHQALNMRLPVPETKLEKAQIISPETGGWTLVGDLNLLHSLALKCYPAAV